MDAILEAFLKELILEYRIEEPKFKRSSLKDFYQEVYTKYGLYGGYQKVLKDLWSNWYVRHFDKVWIRFDEKWLIYLTDAAIKEIEDMFIKNNLCLLCDKKFKKSKQFRKHLETEMHQLRLDFVLNKHQQNHTNLTLKKQNSSTNNITSKPSKKINAPYILTNTSQTPFVITNILPLNPHITDITLNLNGIQLPKVLQKDKRVTIILNGMFRTSAKLKYCINVIGTADGNPMNHMFEIDVNVKSELFSEQSSSLPSDYVPPNDELYNIPEDDDENIEIIPGIPIETESYAVNKFPLKQYKIPKNIDKLLRQVIGKNPEFIHRGKNLHKKPWLPDIAKTFKIPSFISETDYDLILHVLLYIEENQMIHDIKEFNRISTLEYLKDEHDYFILEVPGLQEARPSLIRGDSILATEKGKKTPKYEGIVHKVRETSVLLRFDPKINEAYIKNMKFKIEFGFNRRCLRVEHQAVDLVKNHNVISYFFPKQICPRTKLTTPSFYNRPLNDEQKRAVTNIAECQPNVAPYLIFGPPGTGKTRTVAEAVFQTWKLEVNSKILICAPSNAAVNEIAEILINILPKSELFRVLGNVYGTDVIQQNILRPICNLNEKNNIYIPTMETLLKKRILLTTTITAARLVNGGVPANHFTHVFIDESGYATETETLVPIAGILTSQQNTGVVAGKIILAGDPRQLGPRIHSSFVNYCGFGKSMLERLIDTCNAYKRNENANRKPYDENCVIKLLRNYRSHPSILQVPNELFYNNELIAEGGEMSYIFENWEHLKNPKFPIIFDHVEGEDRKEKDSPSFFNEQEVEIVLKYVEKLLHSKAKGMKITESHIGIISPYRKQIEKINEVLTKKKYNRILAGSIEQFQGREKLVIIISTVRSRNNYEFKKIDKLHDLGFVKNPKRMNVALTRPKALLIVVGNGNVLRKDRCWNKFIQFCHEHNSINGNFHYEDTNYEDLQCSDSDDEINAEVIDFSRGCE